MANPKKEKAPVYYKMNGASLYGKFSTILLTDTAVEVHTTSAFLFILTAWLFACAGFVLGLLTNNYLALIALSVLGGIGGALLVWQCYVGKLRERYPYNDIVSFVLSGADCTVNLKNNKMHTIRMLPKRQMKLMGKLHEVLESETGFMLKRDGNYFRVKGKPQGGVSNEE